MFLTFNKEPDSNCGIYSSYSYKSNISKKQGEEGFTYKLEWSEDTIIKTASSLFQSCD